MTERLTSLDDFDPVSVRRGAAALVLWSPNLDRMGALSELCRSLPATSEDADERADRPAITPADWRAWLAGASGAQVRETLTDGVFDAPTYGEVELVGTRFRLVAGDLSGPEVHYRPWLRALLRVAGTAPDDHVGAAAMLLLAAAGVSELVVRCGRIAFGLPDHAGEGEIAIPDDEDYDLLSAAVEIPLDELGDGIVQLESLKPLLADAAVLPEDRWRFPLIADDERIWVASPADLLSAALVHAAEIALRTPSWQLLLYELQREAIELIERSATDMGWSLVERDGASLLFRFDSDKLAAVELLIAPITPFGARHARAGRDVELAYDRLEERRATDPTVDIGLVVVLGDGRPLEMPLPKDVAPPFGPWVLTLQQLRVIGDAFRLRPTRLWRALRQAPPPPWPDGAETLDVLGSIEHLDGLPDNEALSHGATGARRGEGGAEALYRRALAMAGRHTAPSLEGEPWVTVSRWRGTWDPGLYEPEQDLGRFAILARGPGRYCWIAARSEQREPDDVLAALMRIVGHLTVRLIAAGWLIVPEEELLELEDLEAAIRVEVSFEDVAGPALALGGLPGTGRLVFGPAFLYELARANSDAERMIVTALAHWWLAALGAELLDRLVDHVAPAGSGTLLIWPDPEARSLAPQLPLAASVPPDERRHVRVEVAHHLVGETELLAANGGEESNDVLRRVNELVIDLLDHELACYSPELLADLVRYHERVCRMAEVYSVARPSLAAMDDAGEMAAALDPDDLGALPLRWLIERVAARPPAGSTPPSDTGRDRLRALAEALVEWGSASDAAHAGLGEVRLAIGRAIGCHVVVDGPIADATETVAAAMSAGAPRRALRQHPEWWSEDAGAPFDLRLDEPREPSDELEIAVDREIERAWGFRLEELMRALAVLMDHAGDSSDGTVVEQTDAVATRIHEATRIDVVRVDAIVAALTLGPVADYNPLTKEHKGWSSNRERSYLRRPLVQLPDGRLVWSSAHLLSAGRYLATLIASGRLRAAGPLKLAVQRFSQAVDRDFEVGVREVCVAAGWQADLRVTSLAGQRIERSPAEPLGDIDVLARNPRCARVWLLDGKQIAPALTANDLRNETKSLAHHVKQHRARLDWVRAHVELLEREIGSPEGGGAWEVDAALVTDFPLVGAHLDMLGMSIWSIDQLEAELQS